MLGIARTSDLGSFFLLVLLCCVFPGLWFLAVAKDAFSKPHMEHAALNCPHRFVLRSGQGDRGGERQSFFGQLRSSMFEVLLP